ncbi:hypothetical protein D9M71_381800 [compost metagenome]
MHQHAVFQVVAQATGQDHLLDITAETHHVFDAVAMADADHVLLDDRAGIQLFGDVVAGSTNQLDPTQRSLVVRLGANERRQEAMVDVDHLLGVFLAQLRRQDLHVARQHHHVGTVLLDQARHFGKGRLLVLRVDRDMEERDAVPLDHAAQVIVVGDHAGNIAIEFLGVPAVQQVSQAVGLTAGHQHHALLLVGIGDTPDHRELFGDRRERFAERLDAEWQGFGADFVAHEEPAALLIGVMVRFVDPAVIGRQEITDFGDDANTVGAGNHQPVGAHEMDSRNFRKGAHSSECPTKLQYSLRAACRLPR